MDILEQIYEMELPKIHFLERKISLTNENTILLGATKVGKTYLIYDFLSHFDSKLYLYIDFSDYKNRYINIEVNLNEFIKKNSIEIVILENFDFSFDLPKVTTTIITTKQKVDISNFTLLYLPALDFEEFLLFDNKHQNTTNSFNSFLKYGNLPEIIEYQEIKKSERNYEICTLYCDDKTQFEILFLLIKNSSEKKSILQLYNSLKKQIKISKDLFYKTVDLLIQNKVIFFMEKFNHPRSVKKLFLFNHALIDIVSYKKNFNNLFKNMIFLELNIRYDDLYYIDYVDFYIPSQRSIVLAIPFFNNMISSKIISKLLPQVEIYNITQVTIVTISGEQTIFIDKIETQILPFYKWVLIL